MRIADHIRWQLLIGLSSFVGSCVLHLLGFKILGWTLFGVYVAAWFLMRLVVLPKCPRCGRPLAYWPGRQDSFKPQKYSCGRCSFEWSGYLDDGPPE